MELIVVKLDAYNKAVNLGLKLLILNNSAKKKKCKSTKRRMLNTKWRLIKNQKQQSGANSRIAKTLSTSQAAIAKLK